MHRDHLAPFALALALVLSAVSAAAPSPAPAPAMAEGPGCTSAENCAYFLSPTLGVRSGGTPLSISELTLTQRPEDPQVSPDGRRVAFTVRQRSLAENRDRSDVWVADLPSGPAHPVTREGRSEHARWAPDGKRLVFSSRAPEPGAAPQLMLMDFSPGKGLRRLTHVWGGATSAIWAPDGKSVAFATEVYPPCTQSSGSLEDACNRKTAQARESSQVGARIVTHLLARHWKSWRDDKRSHVMVLAVDVPDAAPRDVTPGDMDWPTFRLMSPDDFALTPDGHLIVSAKQASAEAWSTNSDLWDISLRGGSPQNLTAQNRGDDAAPRVSPDGRYIAYRTQATDGAESDQWKLALFDREQHRARVLADVDDDVQTFAWQTDSKGLLLSRARNERDYFERVDLGGRVTPYSAQVASSDFDLAPDGSAVAVLSGINRPPELYRLTATGPAVALTHFNSQTFAHVNLGPAPEELWVKAADGAAVHSWVLKPPGLAAGQRAPLLVMIHGGPQGSWMDGWSMRWNAAMFAARGYVVLQPDPRGSTGHGHAFELGVSKDWGGKVYDDLMRSVDAAEKLPYVEPGHTCAVGGSFGGFMVNWIAGHTDRFKCLVSHDGVFDLVSMYGSTEELWFPEFEIGKYWEKPELYRQLSPSSYVKNFKTPTLVVEGELDFRVAADQALGMFTALQRQGVESELLWFPDEGHWVAKPRNSKLWYQTVLGWVDRFARPPTPPSQQGPR